MKKRFSFGVTVFLMLVILGLLFMLVVFFGQTFLSKTPDVWTSLSAWFIGWLVMEFVAQYGPKPFRGPLSNIVVRLPKMRDRTTIIIAFAIAYILLYMPKAGGLPFSWITTLSFLFASIASFYGVCFLFGTKDLKALLKIRPKDTKHLIRPDFPHEKFPFLLVGAEKRDAKSFDFARFDLIVQELGVRGYHVSDKYWTDNGSIEFSLYWLERGNDKLALQAETDQGIKLFGQSNLLDEVQTLASADK